MVSLVSQMTNESTLYKSGGLSIFPPFLKGVLNIEKHLNIYLLMIYLSQSYCPCLLKLKNTFIFINVVSV